jgi:alcohol dehydrogenase class IV
MIHPFTFAATPEVHFGVGKRRLLPSLIQNYGYHVLVVTGATAFLSSQYGEEVLMSLHAAGIKVQHAIIDREPSPAMIDDAVNKCARMPDVVVAIGGGSVLDAGKAIAAMLPLLEPVKDYLEGVGTKSHPGKKVPFIALPTTSGTGSEATKNAVLSEVGINGFKKSLRHNNFVPNIAIIDPELTLSCPPPITASSGMDAFTQLLESYVSTAASPITDSLAIEGLRRVSVSLLPAYHDGNNIGARSDMALAAYLSGVTLANAGLGLVHGFASALGGYFEISHGVICSSLMRAANAITIKRLQEHQPNGEAMAKYAAVGKIFASQDHKSATYYIDYLLELIASWTTILKIPRLGDVGVTEKDFEKVLDASDNKNNPIKLSRDEMQVVLKESL